LLLLLLLLFGCAISVVDHLVALHKGRRGLLWKTFRGSLVSIECLPVFPSLLGGEWTMGLV
jgi:hypothetical protein